MIGRRPGSAPPAAEGGQTEGLLRRWAERKRDVRREEEASARAGRPSADAGTPSAEPPPLPAVESLGAESDYSGFMHPKVSETLRRAALRKLFRSAKFNVVDGLDDYAEDYRSFEALGDVMTADLRHQLELAEARRQEAEADRQAEPAPEVTAAEPPAPTASTTSSPSSATDTEAPDELDRPPAERG